ncbi:MAG: hypothetical protein ACXW04_01195 [Methylobacter sp.]
MATQQQQQREAHVAASIYYLGKSIDLSWKEINLAMRMALIKLDGGNSAASAYQVGAGAIRVIARHHALH